MRVFISLLVATAVGLAAIFAIPTLLIMGYVNENPSSVDALPGVVYVYYLIGAAPIWMPLAPIFAAWAYYSCYARLPARIETRRDNEADVRPGWKIFRATIVMYLVMAASIVAWFGEFAYQKNYVCAPGDHIIQSNADAIKQAQLRIIRARYDSHGMPGYLDEKPGIADFSRPDCCAVTKTLTWTGVIVWEVRLDGETIGEPKKRHVNALMQLSNCGAVFDEDSYISAEPIK